MSASSQRSGLLPIHRRSHFDVWTPVPDAYLNILLARASVRVQEDAIRQAEATLKDARALLEGGVADSDTVLGAEVQLPESRDAFVCAQEAELVATAQLNNVMGRNASLPLRRADYAGRDQPRCDPSVPERGARRPAP